MTAAIASESGTYWQWQGHQIYYVRAGEPQPQRPPLLLIHGFGASTDHWRKNMTALSRDFEVWAIDLLGFGRSTKPNIQYSGSLWRDQLHDFVQQVIGRPAVLAGNSLGGYASLCTAAQRSQSVAGVVLLNSAGPFSADSAQAKPNAMQQAIANLSRTLLLQPLPSWLLFQYVRRRSMIRRTLEQVYLDKSVITDQLVEDIYRPSCDAGAAQVFASVFKSPKGETVNTLLAQMDCPLLLLWGEGDPWMDTRTRGAKFRQHYPQLKEVYLQAGHCPHDEVPDQVNHLMQQWIFEHLG
ncbi:MAG: alpha/beta fold hydrolase [Leptolyngbya sp. SIO4C5]|nr:alpha/beta fold hydrolase [Leptolyngbya sp. SIO4C5]